MLFSRLPLSEALLNNLVSLDYLKMTPIQAKSLPAILDNQDVIAKANTGSGKTAAFALGVLSKIEAENFAPQALIICPTRELADQVSKEIRRLARVMPNVKVLTLCGGKPFGMQAESLQMGAHIIVATPGRLLDHIQRKTIWLKQVQTLVLDEADRMLDMGFYDDIIDIVKILSPQRQTLLFSATYPDEIAQMSKSIQRNPMSVSVEAEDKPLITQMAYLVEETTKNECLINVLSLHSDKSAIVFCRTKAECDSVAIMLCQHDFHALALHGDFEQRDREETLLQFANGSCAILVATDVAARGIDIKDLPLVINFGLPADPDTYVHRIGRTGRAGKEGLALTLFNEKERFKLDKISSLLDTPITIHSEAPAYTALRRTPLMRTLCINAGKKNKMRPGDILGALTGEGGLAGASVGKIDIFDFHAYVAIARSQSAKLINKLQGKIKGRVLKMRFLDDLPV
ncbi:MAG: ATP-dependent RNA helicase DbpA [Candidatus Berkiella sp.]